MCITFYEDCPDEPKDCRMNQLGRDSFRMEIYIMENNLRFSEVVLSHKQLRSLGISYSNSAKSIYLFVEIDNDFRCSGRLFAVPWLETLLLRDLIRRNSFENKTKVDGLRGQLKRIYSQNQWRLKRPIHNQELEDRVQIVHWKAELKEFAGANKRLPENAV